MTATRTAVGEIQVASTELLDVSLQDAGGVVTLWFRYERDDMPFESGIVFDAVRAYRRRAESHCTVWHMTGSYDTVVEIEDSEWVAELRSLMKSEQRKVPEMHHFMIYLDSVGCYEVVARSVEFLPETSSPGGP